MVEGTGRGASCVMVVLSFCWQVVQFLTSVSMCDLVPPIQLSNALFSPRNSRGGFHEQCQ